MRGKVILLAITLLSTSLICGARLFTPIVTQSTTYVYPDYFLPLGQTLDQAIHNDTVKDGDTIIVRTGTWYEHLNINKSITLEGGLQGPTILDGKGTGTVVTISASNVRLIDFTIRNGIDGIKIMSSNNTLRNNNITGNYRNFGVVGLALTDFIQDVDASNTVNNKPIRYLVNKSNQIIQNDAGYVAIVNSTRITVKNLRLANNLQGVLVAYTTNSTITNVTTSANDNGIILQYSDGNIIANNTSTNNMIGGLFLRLSDNNTIMCNSFEGNGCGFGAQDSNNNTIYRNNFISNTEQIRPYGVGGVGIFDNGREGNYYTDYTGSDSNGDGIGDTPYRIDMIIDYYPLMEPWSVKKIFSVTRYGDKCNITTLSNSTIARASVNWNRELKRISFNVTSGTAESINITIPRDWLEGYPFEVKLNGRQIEPSHLLISQDGDNSYIFFNYAPDTYMVDIIGTKVLGYRQADLNNDAIVDIYDAILLANYFGKTDP